MGIAVVVRGNILMKPGQWACTGCDLYVRDCVGASLPLVPEHRVPRVTTYAGKRHMDMDEEAPVSKRGFVERAQRYGAHPMQRPKYKFHRR